MLDVIDIDFKVMTEQGDKSFDLFEKVKNYSYLHNQVSNGNGIWTEMKHFNTST